MRRTDSRTIDGRPIQLPMVDVHTVGAGGGSIGWRDRGGALRVGPRSAGAEPGPACYGRGGTEPTVTDANLAARPARRRLGPGRRRRRSTPRRPRGRRDAGRASSASTRWRPPRGSSASPTRRWCGRCGWSPSSAASTPARFALLPFGGAGPMHAAAIADGARDRADALPARRRRPLGARPLRLGPPPRHRPHRDAERRASSRAERVAAEVEELIASSATAGRTPGPRSPTSCATPARRSSCRCPAPRARPGGPARALRAAPTRSATATATRRRGRPRQHPPGAGRSGADARARAAAAGSSSASTRRVRFDGEWIETPVLRGEPRPGSRPRARRLRAARGDLRPAARLERARSTSRDDRAEARAR